jgi:hypothetical protein
MRGVAGIVPGVAISLMVALPAMAAECGTPTAEFILPGVLAH